MYIDQQIGFGKFQFTRLRIQMGGVGTYIYDVGYEHVVRTESNYFLYPTFTPHQSVARAISFVVRLMTNSILRLMMS